MTNSRSRSVSTSSSSSGSSSSDSSSRSSSSSSGSSSSASSPSKKSQPKTTDKRSNAPATRSRYFKLFYFTCYNYCNRRKAEIFIIISNFFVGFMNKF